jgi:hypothetical protein
MSEERGADLGLAGRLRWIRRVRPEVRVPGRVDALRWMVQPSRFGLTWSEPPLGQAAPRFELPEDVQLGQDDGLLNAGC